MNAIFSLFSYLTLLLVTNFSRQGSQTFIKATDTQKPKRIAEFLTN